MMAEGSFKNLSLSITILERRLGYLGMETSSGRKSRIKCLLRLRVLAS